MKKKWGTDCMFLFQLYDHKIVAVAVPPVGTVIMSAWETVCDVQANGSLLCEALKRSKGYKSAVNLSAIQTAHGEV